ncbi:choice-of-anchor P family protein [Streptomyces kaniharaensis]|nr:choice-of-anchor P family protein [Streptomyces kaniharaensis]
MGSRIRRGTAFAALTTFAGTLCSATPAHAALPSPIAHAFVVSSDAIGAIAAVPPTVVSDYPPGGTTTQVGLTAGPFATSGTLTAATAGNPVTGTSSATATVENLGGNLGANIGVLGLVGVHSTCNANAAGATGSGLIDSGSVTPAGLAPVILPSNPAPNTVIVIPALGQLTLNEQSTDVNGVLTVNAFHLQLLPELSGANVIVAHVQCGGAAPAPSIVKSAESSFVEGQTVHYTYTVTNNGVVPLTGITVTDSGPGSPVVTCPAGTLAPAASEVCTATYVATPADAAAGRIVNTATLNATVEGAGAVTINSNELTVPLRALAVTKEATDPDFQAPGATVHYVYTVTNTGRAPLTNVTVTDATPGVNIPGCGTNQLAPAESTTCAATYTTTAADVAAKSVTDQGSASGTDSSGQPVTATSNRVTTTLAALAATKHANPSVFTGAGETITYTVTVTNTGAQPLTNIHVTDNGPGVPTVTCPTGELAPGASVDCTATYTTTAADVAAGRVTDTATATGTTPAGRTVSADTDPLTVGLEYAGNPYPVVEHHPVGEHHPLGEHHPAPHPGGVLAETGAGDSTQAAGLAAVALVGMGSLLRGYTRVRSRRTGARG